VREIPVVRTADFLPLIDEGELIEAVTQGLMDLATGKSEAPMPGLLVSQDPPGDCHVKFARSAFLDLIVVKAATGFYRNGDLGLPVNDGLVTVFSGMTGELRCVIDDGGLLTGMRTAASGVIAARLGRDDRSRTVGIVGTGHQARLQLGWASRHLTDRPVRLFGRSIEKAKALAAELSSIGTAIEVDEDIDAFAAESATIILCTSAMSPILQAPHLRPGHHIVSLGADGPGKMELSSQIYDRATRIAVDDLAQARQRGDFGAAMQRGDLDPGSVHSIGQMLRNGQSLGKRPEEVTLVNLCGTAASDLAAVAYLLALRDRTAGSVRRA
jgi:ornithine cyclodeaminase